MGLLKQFNKGNKFNLDLEGKEYLKLENLKEGKSYKILGLMVYPTKYGKLASIVIDEGIVNLPRHLNDTVEALLKNDEIVESIKEGNESFTVYSYEDTTYNKGTCYSINFD